MSRVSKADSRAVPVRRLNWGCGDHVAPGWINSDVKSAPGVDLVADIRRGLPIESDSVDYAVSVHALPELSLDELVPALIEIHRVLKPGGVLRLVLPDLRRAIEAYMREEDDYFHLVAKDVRTPGARLVTQMLWYGYSRSLFTTDFAAELLQRAGYDGIAVCEPHQTASGFAPIVELDNRERESFYVEGSKPSNAHKRFRRGYNRASAMTAASEVLDISMKVGEEAPSGLKAAHLDGPVAGMRLEGGPLRVVGWAVGEDARARTIEVVSEHQVVATASVEIPRPGVADRFAGVAGAEAAGFDLELEPSGKGVSELLVNAVLDDGSRCAIATIRVDVTRRGMLSRLFG